MTLFRFPPRLMVLQVGRSTSTGKSSEARSANGLKWSRVSSQARIKIPCPAQPAALTTIPRCQDAATAGFCKQIHKPEYGNLHPVCRRCGHCVLRGQHNDDTSDLEQNGSQEG